MHLTRRFSRRALLVLPLLAVMAVACSAPQTTTDPQSDFADTVQNVYLIITVLAAIVFVVVMVLVIVISIAFRERPGREARQFDGNTRLEVLWTLIPVAIVVVIAIPTFFAIADTTKPVPDEALVIEVTGRQWWFEFEYPGLDLVVANEIHIPAGLPVSFKLRSGDVIHSFWVPQLAGKVDMIPGHENDLWFTPHESAVRDEPYLGQCAEFCGLSHANMRFRIYVDTLADFEAWVAAQKADRVEPATEALAAGEQLFLASACVGCHTIQGTAATSVIGPNLSHIASRETIAAGIMANDRANLIRWISNPQDTKPGVVLMPAFETLMTQEQIESIADYLLSLR